MRIAFLLGAGVSKPAGYPSTDELTAELLSGRGVRFHSDRRFYSGSADPLGGDHTVAAVVRTLGALKDDLASWSERRLDYEQLYFVASQLEDALDGEYESAALEPLIARYLWDPRLGDESSAPPRKRTELKALAGLATGYIHDRLCDLLGEPPSAADHLGSVVEALRDTSSTR